MSRSAPWWTSSLALAVTLLLTACGDDDVDVDAGAADGGLRFAAPTPPAAPALTPCPAGWREARSGDDPTTCEPWPEAGRATCSGDEAHFAGEAGCRAVSSACPADGWPAALPAPAPGATTRFVRASAAAGGDGTRATPFATIGAALSGATAGDVIAIGEGDYDEIVIVRSAVRLIGACAARSVLRGPIAPSARGRLDIDAVDVVVRDLGVHGRGLGIWVSAGGSAALEGVVVRDVDLGGILVLGAANLRDVLIRDVGPGAGGVFGRGLHAEGGARVHATRLVVERSRELGVSLGGAGTSSRLEDLVVRDTLGVASDSTIGVGVVVYGGASLELVRAVLEHNRFAGLNAGDALTSVTATDLVVRDTEAQASDGLAGQALFIGGGASVSAQRALLERNRGAEVASYAPGTRVTLEDAVLRDTRGRASDGAMGAGIVATEGGAVALRRVLITRVLAAGVVVDGVGGALDGEDVTIRDVGAQPDGTNGSGVVADRGAALRLVRASLARLRLVGVYAGVATTSTLEDLAVRDVESQSGDGRYGFGVELESGAVLDGERVEIADTRGVALSAFDGATLRLSDVSVSRTRAMACAEGACASVGAGVGVLSRGANLTLTRFFVADGALCGVQVAASGGLDLADGEVARNPVGASVLVDGYDVTRLTRDVVFRGNERNIDATLLPVPDPAVPALTP